MLPVASPCTSDVDAVWVAAKAMPARLNPGGFSLASYQRWIVGMFKANKGTSVVMLERVSVRVDPDNVVVAEAVPESVLVPIVANS